MANLTSDIIRKVRGFTSQQVPIKNAIQLQVGGLATVDTTGFATKKASNDTTVIVVGLVEPTPKVVESATPLLGATSLVPQTYAILPTSPDPGVVEKVTIAGLTAQSSLFALVYCATDNLLADATLTSTLAGPAVGYVSQIYVDSANAPTGVGDVTLFPLTTRIAAKNASSL